MADRGRPPSVLQPGPVREPRLQGREVPLLYDATEDLAAIPTRIGSSAREIAARRQLEDEYAGHAWRVIADDRTVANRFGNGLGPRG